MSLLKQKINVVLLVCILAFNFGANFAFPQMALARGLVPCGGYSDDKGTREPPCNVQFIFYMVARVTNWLISVAGIYAVYKIVQAGWGFTIALGNEEKLTQLKGQITDAVVGFVLVLMAYMMVNFVTNIAITGNLVTTNNPNCKLDLTSPLTYLTIDISKCNNVPSENLYKQ